MSQSTGQFIADIVSISAINVSHLSQTVIARVTLIPSKQLPAVSSKMIIFVLSYQLMVHITRYFRLKKQVSVWIEYLIKGNLHCLIDMLV